MLSYVLFYLLLKVCILYNYRSYLYINSVYSQYVHIPYKGVIKDFVFKHVYIYIVRYMHAYSFIHICRTYLYLRFTALYIYTVIYPWVLRFPGTSWEGRWGWGVGMMTFLALANMCDATQVVGWWGGCG